MIDDGKNKNYGFEQYIWTEESVLTSPESFTKPEDLYQCLIEHILKYHPSSDISMIQHAYRVASKAHEGQKRKSGEDYIIHPLCVGLILTDLRLDKETISAGLLHDVVEDTDMTLEDVRREFGDEVAFLVDGVTKLGQIPKNYDKTEAQAENLKKMFLAMAQDIRVILIKLADRLHNVRTLNFRSPEKQVKVARETIDIYAPLAHRLGISKIKTELDDLSLKYLRPDVYDSLQQKLKKTEKERDCFMNSMIHELQSLLDQSGIHAKAAGHVKHLFSIYRKMINQNKDIEHFQEVFTFRIIVSSIQECYQVLGVIHDHYKPVLEKFKDFIAMPKTNRYQSIHTTLLSKSGRLFDVQIRTGEMHMTSEYGITAYWKYKESGQAGNIKKHNEEKLSWLKQILEWQQDMSDNKEFMSLLKSDFNLLDRQIYCFTPQGEVKHLPNGSNVIDFAYSIHTAIGNKMVGARVNSNPVPLDYQIENGDQIEIITSQNSKGPEKSWIRLAKTTQAKNKINSWFRDDQWEHNLKKGKQLLHEYASQKNMDENILYVKKYQNKIIRKYGLKDWKAVVAAVGHGALKEGRVIDRIMEEYRKEYRDMEETKENGSCGIIIRNVNHPLIRFAKCCCPVPYDEITGYMTKGRGVTIHRTDCVNIIHLDASERNKLLLVEWQEEVKPEEQEMYSAEIRIIAKNRIGMLVDISEIMYASQIDIEVLRSKTSQNGMTTIHLAFQIQTREELNEIMEKLRKINGIQKIERFLS